MPSASLSGNQTASHETDLLPFDESVGYQIRLTNRLVAKHLQQTIASYEVTLGMWYFLRALWHRDGITQRELSTVVGTQEPTTLSALKSMEMKGLVRRVKNREDRRKVNIYLTPKGQALREELLPLAKRVVDEAVEGFSEQDRAKLLEMLRNIQNNLLMRLESESSAMEAGPL